MSLNNILIGTTQQMKYLIEIGGDLTDRDNVRTQDL
jgi:hypothetical protein